MRLESREDVYSVRLFLGQPMGWAVLVFAWAVGLGIVRAAGVLDGKADVVVAEGGGLEGSVSIIGIIRMG